MSRISWHLHIMRLYLPTGCFRQPRFQLPGAEMQSLFSVKYNSLQLEVKVETLWLIQRLFKYVGLWSLAKFKIYDVWFIQAFLRVPPCPLYTRKLDLLQISQLQNHLSSPPHPHLLMPLYGKPSSLKTIHSNVWIATYYPVTISKITCILNSAGHLQINPLLLEV